MRCGGKVQSFEPIIELRKDDGHGEHYEHSKKKDASCAPQGIAFIDKQVKAVYDELYALKVASQVLEWKEIRVF